MLTPCLLGMERMMVWESADVESDSGSATVTTVDKSFALSGPQFKMRALDSAAFKVVLLVTPDAKSYATLGQTLSSFKSRSREHSRSRWPC